jgi:hypothetical protein
MEILASLYFVNFTNACQYPFQYESPSVPNGFEFHLSSLGNHSTSLKIMSNFDSQTTGPKICVNNNSHSLGPILGKVVEPAYQQGLNPTGPT